MFALAAALLLQATQPAPPPGFVPVIEGYDFLGTTASGSNWYIHRGTIVRGAFETRVWIRMDHTRDRTVTYPTGRGLLIIACSARRYRWESLVSFSASGEPLSSPAAAPSDNISPDGMVELAWRQVCPR